MASQIPPTKPADVHGSTTINDDVLYEILLRLPAKPLCRLRAVCRSWRTLLSAPSFIAAHKTRQAGPLLVVRDREHDGSTVSVHILVILSGKSVRHIRIENSRGQFMISLVLMRAPQDLPLVHLPGNIDDGLRLRVLDPATATDFALPHVDHDKQQPYRESFMVGRASTGAYKVLCISTSMSFPMSYLYGHQLCRVLTLSCDHGWRETGCPPAEVKTFHSRDGAAVKGVAYFLLSTNKCIVAYDLEKEVWRTASLPAPVPSREQVIYHALAELGGCLALTYEDELGFMELWLLVDPDQVIWSRLCTISVPYRHNGVQDSSPRLYLAEPLWLLDDGRIIIWMWMDGPQLPTRVLCAYDPRTMTYTDVADMRNYTLGGVFTGSLLDRESIHLLHQ